MTVTLTVEGEIALAAIDNPPVNAAGHAVRQGLVDALAEAEARGAKVLALYGEGRTWVAGADIREFGKPPADPWLPEVVRRLDAATIRVVCALHGTVLGGGLELAMACRRRVAAPGTRLGLPEVTLGIIPGAGGTQLAPRLTGIEAAIALATSGKPIPADEALSLGLIDAIEDGGPRELALGAARAVLADPALARRTSELLAEPDPLALDAARARLERTEPHLPSKRMAVDAIGASHLPFAEGLAAERALFAEAMETPQRAALIHAFFAERAVARIPEAAAEARPIRTVAVVGAGTMGSGIATALLIAGYEVVLIERDEAGLGRGADTIRANLSGAAKRGKLRGTLEDTLERLVPSTDLASAREADLAIEAVFEDMGTKREVLAALDAVLPPGAVLATNTSYLSVAELAAATSRPRDVIGLHFFSPAHVMRLLEVVVPDGASADAVATGLALGKRLRKIAVRAGDADGFIGNRLLMAVRRACDGLVLDGASPQEVDAAMEGAGWAMGNFAVSDLAGLDINWAERKRRAPTRDPNERYSRVADAICEAGWFGRKTGGGWYLYDSGKAVGPNPDVAPLIEAERARHGSQPRAIAAAEIVDRILAALAMEGARIVADGIALRPIDVDAVQLFGYGFPRHLGGPMHAADARGLAQTAALIGRLAEGDPQLWQVPPLLRRLADRGESFAGLNDG